MHVGPVETVKGIDGTRLSPAKLEIERLSSIGNTTHGGFAVLDPLVQSFFGGLSTGSETPDLHDFLRYHSERYFCDGVPLATNGRGEVPLTPALPPSPIHAMFFQGMRHTLFDFNEAYANYQCLRAAGGDVRLLTHETGHNAVAGAPADPGITFQPVGNELWDRCGNVDPIGATLAFFDEHLRGNLGAASTVVPQQVCLSLSAGDRVLVDDVTVGAEGVPFSVPSTIIASGTSAEPAVADLGFVTGSAGDVLAGIPAVDVQVLGSANPNLRLYLGIGQQRAGFPGIWDLVDNQVTPIRGTGPHAVDLVGVAERLGPGDRLALLIYSRQPQFELPASIPSPAPTSASFNVSGSVYLPLLGPTP